MYDWAGWGVGCGGVGDGEGCGVETLLVVLRDCG